MANLFKFSLVPDGLQVTKYSKFSDYEDNINGLDCGTYTYGSTITYGDERYILKDGNDSVIFSANEIVDFIDGRSFLSFANEAAIFDAFKGVVKSSITANQSFNYVMNQDYVINSGNSLFLSGNVPFATINVINLTGNSNFMGFSQTMAKSVNLYMETAEIPSFSASGFLESITIPTNFNNLSCNYCPYLKDVFVYNGSSIRPNVSTVMFMNCALNEESVDRIIKACVAGGELSKTLYLDGGTNAFPSPAVFTDIATLVSRGWTLFYND